MVRDDEKDKINTFSHYSKTHSTLKEKRFISLYGEDLNFLITRAGWLVTRIYAHYTFEQSKFKRDFVIMNQKERQTAESKVEKDFYKLLNNSNFGIVCRNTIDNCTLEPIYDDFSDIAYIKNYTTIFNDDSFRHFFSLPLLREEINQTYEAKIFALNQEDLTYEARKKCSERKKVEKIDAVNSFEKNKKAKKRKFQSIEDEMTDCQDPRKTKMIIDFNDGESASIKSFAVWKGVIKATTRFMSGKLLMFAKLSLKSFVYLLSKTFCFPDEIVKKIYKKYMIEKIIYYHILTDTDSTSFQFVIISDPARNIPEILNFEVIISTKIYNRFDTSHPFWEKVNARKPKKQKNSVVKRYKI